jgi:hypothetical protein
MKISELQQEVAAAEDAAEVTMLKQNGDEYTGSNGEPTVWGILGSDSKRYRDADIKQTRKQWKRPGKRTPEQWLADRIELAASAVAWWTNVEDDDGNAIECSPANVIAILKAAPINVLTQVEEAIGSHAARFTKSSPNS